MRRRVRAGCRIVPLRASLGSVSVRAMRPADQLDDAEVAASPFRAAFGRARFEALSATVTAGDAGGHEARVPATFEYRLLKRRGKRSAEEAAWNALGARGWELVGVTDRHAAFKRPA
jgi:hypothetical protein